MKNVAKYLMSMVLAAFVLVLFFGSNAFADSEEQMYDEESKLYYTIGEDGITITRSDVSDTEVVIPKTINGEVVTRIDNQAFAWNSNITSIIIPDTVTSIGFDAFSQTGITSIIIPESVKNLDRCVFNGCVNLSEVILPKNLTNISVGMFVGCSSLERIDIPESVTSIGDQAFSGCSSLGKIKIPSTVSSIGADAFRGCDKADFWVIKSSYAEEYLKYNKLNYKFIDNKYKLDVLNDTRSFNVVSASLVTIGESDTDQYSDYLEIAMEDDTFDKAFVGESEDIDEDIELIEIEEGNVFAIPAKMDGPFVVSFHSEEGWYECGFNIKDENDLLIYENIDYSDIYEYTVGEDGVIITNYRSSDTEVVIPKIINGEFVTRIGNQAFALNSDMTSIIIPDTVTSIGGHAFYECSSLESIEISQGVTSIGDMAFEGCSSLESIEIPEGVTSIGFQAFTRCSSLEKIIIPSTVSSIGDNAFYGCDKAKFYVAKGSYAEEYLKKRGISYEYTDPEDPTEDKSEATTEKKSETPTVSPSEKDNTKAPAKVKLKSAKNVKGKKVKALWKKVTGAKGYEIQYSTNKKFKKAKTKTTKKTTFVIKKLKKKKTYYIRVRAYTIDASGKKVPGKWSKVKKVKVSK